MKKKWWIICFILLVGIIFYFDSVIVQGISKIQTSFLDDFFMGVGAISSEIVIFFVLTSLFLWQERKRKWILPLWVTLGISAVVSFLLKVSISRARPFQIGIASIPTVLEKANHFVWNYSFPSFHSGIAFCAVPILAKEFPRLKYVWIVFAILIAFSRVYFGLHFLSDVVLGGVIGILIGNLIIKLENKTKFGEKVYNWIFRRN